MINARKRRMGKDGCCEVVLVGLKSFANTKLDFVDCLMSGYQTEGHEIYTFDKELRKYLQRHT
jgi:hypothetical protein